MISNNVMKMDDIGDEVWYRIGCACGGGDDCAAEINFEFDQGEITIIFHKRVTWADYTWERNFFFKMLARVKMAFQVLFKGYLEMEGCFYIDSLDHLDSMIEALKEGKGKILALREIYQDE